MTCTSVSVIPEKWSSKSIAPRESTAVNQNIGSLRVGELWDGGANTGMQLLAVPLTV